MQDDACNTNLQKNVFDAVILRDSLYNFTDFSRAMMGLVELLRPGGNLVVIDGNYFRYLHDPKYKRRNDYFILKDGMSEYQHMVNLSNEDYQELESLVGNLEVNMNCRPYIGLKVLMQFGLDNIRMSCDDGPRFDSLTEYGRMNIPMRYTIVAQKSLGSLMESDVRKLYSCRQESKEDTSANDISNVFQALSKPERIMILEKLLDGPCCVKDIAQSISVGEKLTSYHLGILRDAGLVGYFREGRETYY